MCNVIHEFFTTGTILPHFNDNNVVLIPKSTEAYAIHQFRLIAMTNFKFEIISKVLDDILTIIFPDIITNDCVCITSLTINILHHKSFHGNLALKIDIAKSFDPID